MEIVITPKTKIGIKESFLYVKLIREVFMLVYQRDPNATCMHIMMNEAQCEHDYRFTGTTLNQASVVMCRKCKTVIQVRQKDESFVPEASA